jgi:hypothetical protein
MAKLNFISRLNHATLLGHMQAYGMAGVQQDVPYDFLDSYPSLLIAASDYVRGAGDHAWLEKNYPGLKVWAARMLAMDRDGKGLLVDNYQALPAVLSRRQPHHPL